MCSTYDIIKVGEIIKLLFCIENSKFNKILTTKIQNPL